jgi:WD40 repeat protein
MPLISDQAQTQSWMIPYFVPGLENTSSVAWSPDGRLLVVGYRDVPTLVVWDVAEHRYTMLRQGPRCGTTQLEFHADGTYLLQSLGYHELIRTNQLQIWETATWDMQKLTTAATITSMQWIPSTKMFLFSMKGSPKVHLLQMKAEPPILDVTNAPSVDLPTLTLPAVQSHSSRPIRKLWIDPSGCRLAVAFEGVPEVGLFHFRMRPLPDLAPM